MNKSKHLSASKPKLFVEFSHFQPKSKEYRQKQYKNEVQMKPLRSVKNLHQLKRYNFDSQNVEIFNPDKRLFKLQKLEQEKLTLMQSLQILKMSAISAIVEKQDQLEKLRQENTLMGDDRLQFYEQELQRNRRLCQDLQEERELMQKKMSQERSRYISDLQQKQYLIEALREEIQDIRSELQLFQAKDLIKTQQIKLLLEENCHLSEQLQLNTFPTVINEIKSDSIEMKTYSPTSAASTSPQCPQGNFISPLDYQTLFLSEEDRTYLNNKLEQKDKFHKSQILDLKKYYQKQINGLKEIFQREINLPIKDKHAETYHTVTRSASKQSLRSHKNEKTFSYCPSDDIIEQDIENDDNIIEEDVENEQQISRCAKQNLKNEIKAYNAGRESFIKSSDDAQSEFTVNHFENPFRFMNRARSIDTFTDMDFMEIKPNCIEVKENKTQKTKETINSDWSKPFVFMTGLFSGITATSMVGYFLNRNRV